MILKQTFYAYGGKIKLDLKCLRMGSYFLKAVMKAKNKIKNCCFIRHKIMECRHFWIMSRALSALWWIYILQIPMRARFSASIQNDPGAYPASYKIGTGSLSRG